MIFIYIFILLVPGSVWELPAVGCVAVVVAGTAGWWTADVFLVLKLEKVLLTEGETGSKQFSDKDLSTIGSSVFISLNLTYLLHTFTPSIPIPSILHSSFTALSFLHSSTPPPLLLYSSFIPPSFFHSSTPPPLLLQSYTPPPLLLHSFTYSPFHSQRTPSDKSSRP